VGTGKEGRERGQRAQKQNVKRGGGVRRCAKMESGVRVGGESRLAFVLLLLLALPTGLHC
jgi:hypothetical protein